MKKEFYNTYKEAIEAAKRFISRENKDHYYISDDSATIDDRFIMSDCYDASTKGPWSGEACAIEVMSDENYEVVAMFGYFE